MKYYTFLLFVLLVSANNCLAQADSIKGKARVFPLAKEWFIDRDIDLALPFGVSAFFTHMSRNVDIYSVEVSAQDIPNQSVNDFLSFELNNKTTVAAIKADAWVFPFLNVYGLFGFVSTNASLDATITYDRVILPGPPVIIPVSNNSRLNGSYCGIGTTMVGGHKNWFVLGDVNYGYSKLNEFEGKIDFWMYSGRTGFQSKLADKNIRTWVGAMYLYSKRKLELRLEDNTLGDVRVQVFQETMNPWTFQIGSSYAISKHFEVLWEIGTNFNDASIGVVSTSYRF